MTDECGRSDSFQVSVTLNPSGPAMECYQQPVVVVVNKPETPEESDVLNEALNTLRQVAPHPLVYDRREDVNVASRIKEELGKSFSPHDHSMSSYVPPSDEEMARKLREKIEKLQKRERALLKKSKDPAVVSEDIPVAPSFLRKSHETPFTLSNIPSGIEELTDPDFLESQSPEPDSVFLNPPPFSIGSSGSVFNTSPFSASSSEGGGRLPLSDDPESIESSGVNPSVVSDLVWNIIRAIKKVQDVKAGTPNRAGIYRELSDVCNDFKKVALSYCETAIREIGLPDEAKTLKYDENVGGEAGGAKIVVIDYIRIKNPEVCKTAEIYDNQYYKAQKSVKREFHYSDMMFEIAFNKGAPKDFVVFPAPCMVVHYLGHTFLVSVKLPLGGRVVGRSDSERPSPVKDERIVQSINQLLEPLGLAKHGFRRFDPFFEEIPPEHYCALPFDAELYKSLPHAGGFDGLYFVVGTGRMMPPGFDISRQDRHNPFLYKHMRKESVKWYYVHVLNKQGGLSCDAFSAASMASDDEEVKKAYAFYLEHIPRR